MPGYRGKRFLPIHIKRDINRMMDIFPKLQIRVTRLLSQFTLAGAPVVKKLLIYEGEALVRIAQGDTEGYGLGTVENQSLVIVINGVFPIAQGDMVTINDGRQYEVDFQPTHMHAFMVLNLQQRSQVTQVTQ
jgi:hypothetical protein